MAFKYQRIEDWLAAVRRRAERNADNFIPIFGKPGDGKSTVAMQIGCALDSSLDVDRILFGVQNFMAGAVPPRDLLTFQKRRAKLGSGHRVVIGDELELNKRRGMYGVSLDLIEFLKDCRGLNLHMLACFNEEEDVDKPYLRRATFKAVIPRRGLLDVYEMERRFRIRRGGIKEEFDVWVKVGSYETAENAKTNPLWMRYEAKKEDHMAGLGEKYEQPAGGGLDAGGVDHERAVLHFKTALRQFEERQGAQSDVRGDAET